MRLCRFDVAQLQMLPMSGAAHRVSENVQCSIEAAGSIEFAVERWLGVNLRLSKGVH
jgi:hypothetical protein